eukprot:Plantae.Rhodophyta-Purpureofilum_apyrenoidigerum.ctg28046.p1 GENE.Plantae.Rhodophyta-Purpureofilum_apyrenoidigerum.ctg28046~~Plantae.Rhodophyta-Purpureofilum_apyrenoidigerum.ctg28046.p1  ORF type:complete len:128 (-),score=4.42 Plantae.Rhodophyta-Purpureofilum_apyrenoidigerum.ctg28046:96-479(-)
MATLKWVSVGGLILFWCSGLVAVYCWSESAVPLYATVTILMGLLTVGLGRRGSTEKSAYSVFNKDCERLPGQLTAEQFEDEIRHKEVGRPSRSAGTTKVAETEEQRFQRLLKETRQEVRREAARRRH